MEAAPEKALPEYLSQRKIPRPVRCFSAFYQNIEGRQGRPQFPMIPVFSFLRRKIEGQNPRESDRSGLLGLSLFPPRESFQKPSFLSLKLVSPREGVLFPKRKLSVEDSPGARRRRILPTAVSAASTAASAVGRALITLPHFSTLFSGNFTLAPASARTKRSFTPSTRLASSRPARPAMMPGREMKARSAEVQVLFGSRSPGSSPTAMLSPPSVTRTPEEYG